MDLIPFQLSKLDKLPLKPPPAQIFEELLGYSGSRRWVGFYYEYGCLYHSDGEGRIRLGNWQPWLIWHWSLRHDMITTYCFGYDDHGPEDMLVLDRKGRTLYAGSLEVASKMLRQQIPFPHPQQGTDEDHQRRHATPHEYLFDRDKLDAGLEQLEMWLRDHAGGCAL